MTTFISRLLSRNDPAETIRNWNRTRTAEQFAGLMQMDRAEPPAQYPGQCFVALPLAGERTSRSPTSFWK